MAEEAHFTGRGLNEMAPLRFALLILCLVALSGLMQPTAGFAQADAGFQRFLQDLWPLAQAKGVRRETFETAVKGLEPDPTAPSAQSRQAEFDKPLKAYLAEAASKERIQRGRTAQKAWGGELGGISRRFGVADEILVAAWGIETDFGRASGAKDIIRSLATLAYRRPDREIFRDELISALIILDKGEVPREKMRGSWAGAMGGPQFLPSAYLKYAVSADGSAFPDIWDKPQDCLASIANFLRQSGWRPGLPWGMEVVLPAGFDFASLHRSFPAFASLGVSSADGGPLPAAGEATLFLPSGAAGPAFLLSENYWVLKLYNNSDSYALSLALLADRIDGKADLRAHWPANETFLSRTQKAEIQRLLEKLGFYRGAIDGRFGQASRDAIHDFQVSVAAHPTDGYGSLEVLRRLKEGVERTGQ
ncbi:lytic murein transglycosylase [Methylocapsa aurea]|uniref:lytic murein transglycosylase n=1 Tax=Methylocapsa aurea TaxID=663610 RepID=UPI001FD9A3CC|nr:lytic murein transglycosylase [Methylocapsa aurea]